MGKSSVFSSNNVGGAWGMSKAKQRQEPLGAGGRNTFLSERHAARTNFGVHSPGPTNRRAREQSAGAQPPTRLPARTQVQPARRAGHRAAEHHGPFAAALHDATARAPCPRGARAMVLVAVACM